MKKTIVLALAAAFCTTIPSMSQASQVLERIIDPFTNPQQLIRHPERMALESRVCARSDQMKMIILQNTLKKLAPLKSELQELFIEIQSIVQEGLAKANEKELTTTPDDEIEEIKKMYDLLSESSFNQRIAIPLVDYCMRSINNIYPQKFMMHFWSTQALEEFDNLLTQQFKVHESDLFTRMNKRISSIYSPMNIDDLYAYARAERAESNPEIKMQKNGAIYKYLSSRIENVLDGFAHSMSSVLRKIRDNRVKEFGNPLPAEKQINTYFVRENFGFSTEKLVKMIWEEFYDEIQPYDQALENHASTYSNFDGLAPYLSLDPKKHNDEIMNIVCGFACQLFGVK